MCKYCEKGLGIESVQSDLQAYAFIDDDKKEFTTGFTEVVHTDVEYGEDTIEYYIDVAINYCPMCGRNLKESEQNDTK